MTIRSIPRRQLAGLMFAALCTAAPAAFATQWDVTAGAFHTHLISTEGGFQLHVHDKATHGVVDTRKGKVVATLLSGGKPQTIPLAFVQPGVLAGARPLAGDWTLLVRFDMPGAKPAQVRYSSKMKPGAQDLVPAAVKGGAARDQGHDHHDHAQKK